MPSAAISPTTSSAFVSPAVEKPAPPPVPNAQPSAAKPAPGAATAKAASKAARRGGDPEPFAKALSRAAESARPQVQEKTEPEQPAAGAAATSPQADHATEPEPGETTESGQSDPKTEGAEAKGVRAQGEPASKKSEARADAEPKAGEAESARVVATVPEQPETTPVPARTVAEPPASIVQTPERPAPAAISPESAGAAEPHPIDTGVAAQVEGEAKVQRPTEASGGVVGKREVSGGAVEAAAGQVVAGRLSRPARAEAEEQPRERATVAGHAGDRAAPAHDRVVAQAAGAEADGGRPDGESEESEEADAPQQASQVPKESAEPAQAAQSPTRKRAAEPAPRHESAASPAVSGQAVQPAPDAGARAAPSSVFTFEGLRVGGVSVAGGEVHASRGAAAQAQPQRTGNDLSQSAFEATVSRGLGVALNQRGGAVTIRLQPESLGAMRIHLDIEQGLVQGRFEVATPEARELLSKSMDTLRTALESRGLSVDRLQVHLASPGDGTPSRGGQEQGDRQGGGARQDAADGRSRGSFEQGGGPGGREREGQPRSGGFEEVWGLAGAERPAEPLILSPWSGAGRLAVDAVG